MHRAVRAASDPHLGVHQHQGWRIKLYSIVYGDADLDRALYDVGLALALNDLPQPAIAAHRPGVGFAIFHQGRGWHYLVLNWWDNENELPQRIWVQPREMRDARWRRADPNQSICVGFAGHLVRTRDVCGTHIV